MALTLREASKEAFDNNETLRASIIMQFAESSDIIDRMGFDSGVVVEGPPGSVGWE